MNSTTPRILLVEDNAGDAFLVRKLLTDSSSQFGLPSVTITHVSRIGDALDALGKNAYEAILLDLSLPDSQGIDSIRKVAQVAPRTAIIVLTGLDNIEASLAAVHEGAQDYLLKAELNSHSIVRALCFAMERKRLELERLAAQTKSQILDPAHVSSVESGNIRLNLLNQTLIVSDQNGSQNISLPPREFKLLLYFLKNEGRIVGRDEILAHVWSDDDAKPNPRCIDTLVSSLKKKSIVVENRIESIYGEGYRFVKDMGQSKDRLNFENIAF